MNITEMAKENKEIITNNRGFGGLLTAAAMSSLGNQLQRFGLPWLVYHLSGSGALMALNFSLSLIPSLFFSLIGGVISDSHDRRKIMVLGDILSGVLVIFVFSIHVLDGEISLYLLFALTFLLSSISAIYDPTFYAAVPKLVNSKDLVMANSIFSISQSIISLVGPTLAGIVIGFFGAWTCIIINAISFFASAIFIWLIPVSMSIESRILTVKKISIIGDLKTALKFVRDQHWLIVGLTVTGAMYLSTGSIGSLLQFFFLKYLHLSGFMFGFTFVLFEFLPVLVIGFVASKLSTLINPQLLVFIGGIFFSLSMLILGSTLIYPIVVIGGMLQNASAALTLISWNSMCQSRVPNQLLGKVTGISITMQSILLPVGGLLSSIMVNWIAVPKILIGFGLVSFFITTIAALVHHMYSLQS